MKKDFIGVFDSGVGGLTVLDKIVDLLPNENYIYIADQGNCPYGPKSQEFVGDRVEKICKYFENEGAKAVVIGCNTATLQIKRGQDVCNIPIIGVIKPTCERAIQTTKNKIVAVLATEATIKAGSYQKMLVENGITPVPLACPSFVDFVENFSLDDKEGLIIVKEQLDKIKNEEFDTLIHGCTHFSLLQNYMEKFRKVNYVGCGTPTSELLKEFLEKENKLNKSNQKGTIKAYTTGDVEKANNASKWFNKPFDGFFKIDI